MPCIDPENTPLPGDLENVLLRKLLNRLCNISSGGGGGGVSQAYVDARDAATLASANAFTNAGLAGKENVANKSTDGTFAANSDTLYPSQKAAKTYVDNAITVTAAGLYVLKAGDTMTGALLLPAGAVGAPSLSHVADANTGLWFPAADTIALSTSGAERLRILSTGEVGIGTASPNVKLDVSGSGNFIGGTNPLVDIGDSFNNDILRVQYDSAGNYGSIQSYSGGAITKLILNGAGGNVGIGITAPLAKLHITPSASGTDYFRIDHSDGTPRLQVGVVPGAATYGGIWLGNVVPSATNHVLISDGSTVILNSAAAGEIYFSHGGTALWNIQATTGHLLAFTDNTYDIGASGASRPRDVFVAGKITIGSVAALITSSAAMNNGAAASLGTLTNAPAAGNPTKWIPIDDNGTTRYIPAW